MERIERIAKNIDDRWGEGTSDKLLKFTVDFMEKLAVRWYAVETH